MNCPTCGSENAADSRFCEDCGAQLSASAEGMVAVAVQEGPLSEGRVVLDRFRIEQLLEEGRIHRYRASDLETEDRQVLLLETASGEADALTRQFSLITEAAACLQNLWIPEERLESEGRVYLSGSLPGMERLSDRLNTAPLSPSEAIGVGSAAATGLSGLHQAGLLHLALQPSRIWLGPEGVRVDPVDRLSPVDPPGENYQVTAGFSAPEAYGMQGGVVDARSDVFSLGAVLHLALTGQQPDLESRETFFSFPRPQIAGAPELVDAVMKAVAKSPADRFASMDEFRTALERAALGPSPVPEAAPVTGFQVALRTDIGCVRSVNQDACSELRFTVWEKDVATGAHMVVVADGMGGEAEGDKAASLAVRSLAREVLSSVLHYQVSGETNLLLPPDPVDRAMILLQKGIETANRVIFNYSQLEPSRRGMGCTMTAVILVRDVAVFGHVGDTRGYCFTPDLDLVTTDHSLVGRLVQMGQMSREEARNSPQRSIIYRALGTNPDVEVDLYQRRLAPGQYLLICSDGVWEYYQDEELIERFCQGGDPGEIADWLVRTCLDRGADDNTTCAVIRAEG
ncbi:MAG: protein phosphatase 2C domain-containing protein [Candidatus Eremiobacterota bacterium]